MIADILETIRHTFLDGFEPKPLTILPAPVHGKDTCIATTARPYVGQIYARDVTRLATPEEHRGILREALLTATGRVLIVSPFITLPAVQADRIPDLVRACVLRRVTVAIYTDARLNLDSAGRVKETFRDAVGELQAAGARVTLARAIHNKTLCIDDKAIVEGSYNWLSAVRDERSRNRRQECSIIYCGKGVEKMISDAVTEISLAGL